MTLTQKGTPPRGKSRPGYEYRARNRARATFLLCFFFILAFLLFLKISPKSHVWISKPWFYKKAKGFHLECKSLIQNNKLDNYVKDQLGRASFSVVLNIAEGSGKFSKPDRRNWFTAQPELLFLMCSHSRYSSRSEAHWSGGLSDIFN